MRMRPATFLVAAGTATAMVGLWLLLRPVPGAFGFGEVLRAVGAGVGLGSADATHLSIVYDVRLPRIVTGVCAGASLALAGVVMQAVFKNPLASPDVMGTQAGSALGAAVAIALGWASASVLAAPTFAFAGAAAVSGTVYLAAAERGGVSVVGILLAGMAMNSLIGAATAFFVSFFYRDQAAGEILQWLMGGLENVTADNAAVVAAGLLVFGIGLVPFARDMDLLTLPDSSAGSLGVDVTKLRKVLLALACAITATAVSVTGGIVFVGLVVPHAVRLLVGPAHRALLPCSAVAGGLVLLLADAVVLAAGSAVGLRIGVVTALLGAPFFLWLLMRHHRGVAL